LDFHPSGPCDRGRYLYLNYLDNKCSGTPNHESSLYKEIYEQILKIKISSNAARTEHALPLCHQVTITKYWLLGFIEGEGCFSYHDFSMNFSLPQTMVNRYVLEAIRVYLISYASLVRGINISITDGKPNKGNQSLIQFNLYHGWWKNTNNL
jgi:hypothetical protein